MLMQPAYAAKENLYAFLHKSDKIRKNYEYKYYLYSLCRISGYPLIIIHISAHLIEIAQRAANPKHYKNKYVVALPLIFVWALIKESECAITAHKRGTYARLLGAKITRGFGVNGLTYEILGMLCYNNLKNNIKKMDPVSNFTMG